MMKYHDQIKHPLWQKKRLEVLTRNGFECSNCGSKDQELHVHHPFYKRGAMIWDYMAEELECLCHKCHKDAHALDERFKKASSLVSGGEKWFLVGYMDACSASDDDTIFIENYEHGAGIGSWFDPPLTSPEIQKLCHPHFHFKKSSAWPVVLKMRKCGR